MIHGSKSMIAECLERMRESECDGCDRKDACASLFRRFGFDSPRIRRSAPTDAPRPQTASPFLAMLGEIARAIETRMAPPRRPSSAFRRKAETKLEPLLPAGEVRMDALARALGCSRQTLYRRLRAEGTTFETLLDGLRRRLARRLLREERLSVKETSYRLGFADPAAFSRAFKRWTGSSPRTWRDRGFSGAAPDS
jgi:AraC-like DNA-binding protein